MKWVIRILGLVAVLAVVFFGAVFVMQTKVRPAPDVVPGYVTTTLDAAHRDEPLPLTIWYPTDDTSDAPELIGQNALFYGHYVNRDATPLAGPHPLVVLVHGSGGNAERFGWLASQIANAGYIVAASDHPGTRSMDSRQADTLRIWERPADVAAILDFMATTPPDGLSPKGDDAAVVGFSIGGQTALLLGGLTYDRDAFVDYCDGNTDWDCGWYASVDFDFETIDADAYSTSRRDPRIAAVVAIDPAGAPAAIDGADIQTPSLILNLGNAGEIFDGVRADDIAAAAGGAYATLPQSWHFSFLAECSMLGDVIMRVMGEELICSDSGLRDRADVHADAIAQIIPFLDAQNRD